MRTSANYNLKLMEGTDNVKRQDFVDNFETIDTVIKNINDNSFPNVIATGTNTYVGSTDAIKSLDKGIKLTLFVGNNASGNATLNLNSYGAKNIKDSLGNIVTNLKANIPYNLCFNGTDFILQGNDLSSKIDSVQKTLTDNINTVNNNLSTKIDSNQRILNTTIISKGNNYAVTSGSATNYTISIDGITAYTDGLTICITPHVNCGASPVLKINSLAELQIKNSQGDLLVANDLLAGVPILLVRVGNYFFIRASNRLGNTDNITDPDPTSTPTLIASVAYSGTPIIARIKNYAQIYIINDNNLYLFDCLKKKETLLGSGFINKARPDTIDYRLKEWNGYWVYGSRIFSKGDYRIVKDFYNSVGYVTSPSYKYDEDSKGHSETKTSNFYNDNYLLLDSVANKLYLIKAIANPSGFFTQYGQYGPDKNNYYMANMPYRFEVYIVNNDLSTTYKCGIAQSNTTWACEGFGTEIIGIKNDVIYMKCLSRPITSPNVSTSTGSFDVSNISSNATRFTKYSLLSGSEISGLYSAPAAIKISAHYTANTGSNSSETFSVNSINSPYGDRFIMIEHSFSYSSYSKSSDRKAETINYRIYDMLLDTEIYSYYYSDSDSDDDNAKLTDVSPNYTLAKSGGLCNNPLSFISSLGMQGYKKGTTKYYQELDTIYNYAALTSKYGIRLVNAYSSKFAFDTINHTTITLDEYYSLMYNNGYRGTTNTRNTGSEYYVLTISNNKYTFVRNYVNSPSSTSVKESHAGIYISDTSYIANQNYLNYSTGNCYQIYLI